MKLASLMAVCLLGGCVTMETTTKLRTVPLERREQVSRTFSRRATEAKIDGSVIKITVNQQTVQEITTEQRYQELRDITVEPKNGSPTKLITLGGGLAVIGGGLAAAGAVSPGQTSMRDSGAMIGGAGLVAALYGTYLWAQTKTTTEPGKQWAESSKAERVVASKPIGSKVTVITAYSTHEYTVPSTGELSIDLPEPAEQLALYTPSLIVAFDNGESAKLGAQAWSAAKNRLLEQVEGASTPKKLAALRASFPRPEGFQFEGDAVFDEVAAAKKKQADLVSALGPGDKAFERKRYGEALRLWREQRGQGFDNEIDDRMTKLKGKIMSSDVESWDEALFFFPDDGLSVRALFNPAPYDGKRIRFKGVVERIFHDANGQGWDSVVIGIGDLKVLVKTSRTAEFVDGTPVEVLGFISGTSQVTTVIGRVLTVPTIHGVWIRSLLE